MIYSQDFFLKAANVESEYQKYSMTHWPYRATSLQPVFIVLLTPVNIKNSQLAYILFGYTASQILKMQKSSKYLEPQIPRVIKVPIIKKPEKDFCKNPLKDGSIPFASFDYVYNKEKSETCPEGLCARCYAKNQCPTQLQSRYEAIEDPPAQQYNARLISPDTADSFYADVTGRIDNIREDNLNHIVDHLYLSLICQNEEHYLLHPESCLKFMFFDTLLNQLKNETNALLIASKYVLGLRFGFVKSALRLQLVDGGYAAVIERNRQTLLSK